MRMQGSGWVFIFLIYYLSGRQCYTRRCRAASRRVVAVDHLHPLTLRGYIWAVWVFSTGLAYSRFRGDRVDLFLVSCHSLIFRGCMLPFRLRVAAYAFPRFFFPFFPTAEMTFGSFCGALSSSVFPLCRIATGNRKWICRSRINEEIPPPFNCRVFSLTFPSATCIQPLVP